MPWRAALLLALFSATVPDALALPNFVVTIHDDVYYGRWTTGSDGGTSDYNTPPIPSSVDGTSKDMEYLAGVATPGHDRVKDEGVFFSAAYCSSPVCAPARYSVLTGRYASKSLTTQNNGANNQFNRTKITVPLTKVRGDCSLPTTSPCGENTVAQELQNIGYNTIHTGKYHLMHGDTSDYAAATAEVQAAGFTHVGGLYAANINDQLTVNDLSTEYTHNMEWLVKEAKDHITTAHNAGNPWYLWFAPTVPHSPNVMDALTDGNVLLTPSGTLNADPTSGAGLAMTRQEVIDYASTYGAANSARSTTKQEAIVGLVWVDSGLEAIINHVESLGQLDNTFIFVTMDHGQVGKNELIENGGRTAAMARYPSLISAGISMGTPVSGIDVAPTVLELAGVTTLPYTMDGKSLVGLFAASSPWTEETNPIIYEQEFGRTFVKAIEYNGALKTWKLSNWMVPEGESVRCTSNYQEDWDDVCDTEQLYDLTSDPTEQVNLLEESGGLSAEASAAYAVLIKVAYCHDVDTTPITSITDSTFFYPAVSTADCDDLRHNTAATATACWEEYDTNLKCYGSSESSCTGDWTDGASCYQTNDEDTTDSDDITALECRAQCSAKGYPYAAYWDENADGTSVSSSYCRCYDDCTSTSGTGAKYPNTVWEAEASCLGVCYDSYVANTNCYGNHDDGTAYDAVLWGNPTLDECKEYCYLGVYAYMAYYDEPNEQSGKYWCRCYNECPSDWQTINGAKYPNTVYVMCDAFLLEVQSELELTSKKSTAGFDSTDEAAFIQAVASYLGVHISSINVTAVSEANSVVTVTYVINATEDTVSTIESTVSSASAFYQSVIADMNTQLGSNGNFQPKAGAQNSITEKGQVQTRAGGSAGKGRVNPLNRMRAAGSGGAPPPPPSASSDDDDGLAAGAVAGVAVGSAIIGAVLGAVAVKMTGKQDVADTPKAFGAVL